MSDFIMNLINNNLFPIAMCLLLYWDKREDSKQHKAEMDLMSKSLNDNTLALQKLSNFFETRLSDLLDRKE